MIGVPIAIALGMAAFALYLTFTTVDMSIAPQVMFKAVNPSHDGNPLYPGGKCYVQRRDLERLVKFASSLVEV